MKLLGDMGKNIHKDENGESVPHLVLMIMKQCYFTVMLLTVIINKSQKS